MNNLVWKLNINNEDEQLVFLRELSGDQTFAQISNQLPEGVYTTFRTYERDKALRLEDHFQRLEHSAALMQANITPLSLPRKRLRISLGKVIADFPQEGDLRIRLTVDLEDQPGMLYITIGPLKKPSPEAYQKGVKLVTWDLQRKLAQAKRTSFIQRAELVRADLPPDVNEAIMVTPEGHLLEGLTSNFFAVSRGELYTAGKGVLRGITRSLVLEAAEEINLNIHLQPLALDKLSLIEEAAEAFISSTSRGILPVREINDIQLGSTVPGEITRHLMAAFDALLLGELQPI
jgi:branched-chain amino acid aminotransferase